ncbi:alpha/beta hydrolase [Polaribacter sp. SA4-10]|uniref:alpha/beta hydrolase family protein n=1 Tax=Polaribacter sp. SA4-10 TaxID=754397 RepID=UPI000B3C8285|nr:alpha/beta fold hydrolase [Polaribacter sp. SA4-10]ARV07001.1 alpha/beta hydrolase [Polaribacter sp. SA4-10]
MKISKDIILQGKHNKPILTDVFFKETHQQKPVVIFCHGYKGFKDWGAWNLMAEALAKAGFFFIKFNFSHNGGTVEQPIDFPDLEAFGTNNYTKEVADLETVIDWISTNHDFKNEVNIDAISLIGHSRGGGIVLLKSNEDARIKKVITLAGVSDYKSRFPKNEKLQEWKEKGVFYVKNGRTHQEMPHFYQFYEDFIKNENRLNIQKAAQNLKIPQLIIHGDNDTSVLINEAESLKKWNPNSEFKIIENANHVFNVSHPWVKKSSSEAFEKTIKSCINFLKQ